VDEPLALVPEGPDFETGVAAATIEFRVTPAAAAHLAAWRSDQQLAALHEAGHAVVGALCGIPVRSVDIRARPARTEFGMHDDTQPTYRSASRIRAEIKTALAGLLTELHLLSEGTSGAHDDLLRATDAARELVDAGLHPRGPLLSIRAFGLRGERIPEQMLADYVDLVAEILEEERGRTTTLVARHADAIVGLAQQIYARRRLSDSELSDALLTVGISPPPAPDEGR
jgi:cell division protease FtsH